ncbi:MAG: MATE family efflux transporter, partial [Oscillospiraceae bacterium]|nr:MATE family efflux transporter [Oscillospiraceae bacterium]
NGSSELLNNISMSLVGMLYNIQLLKYAGENGVAAYGTIMYVSFAFAAAFIGYSIGVAPVISYNYGAANHKELRGLLRKSGVVIAVFAVSMLSLAWFMAMPLSKLFVGYDAELLAMTCNGFRVYSFAFLFMGFAIFGSGFFTALNDGVTSAIISFLRTMVFQTSAVMLLPLIWGINGIWISVIVAEGMAVFVSLILLKKKQKIFNY